MDPVSLAVGLLTLPTSLIQTIRELKDALARLRNSKNELSDTINGLNILIQCTSKLQYLREQKRDKILTGEDNIALWNHAVQMLLGSVGKIQKTVEQLQKGSTRDRVSHALGLDAKEEHEKDLIKTLGFITLAISVFNAETLANPQSYPDVSSEKPASLNTPPQAPQSFTRLGCQLDNFHVNPHFVRRSKYEIALEKCLLPDALTTSRKVFVLYGLGGIGKTQLAVNFGIKHQDTFNSVLFADGSSRESVVKSYSLFYRRLNAIMTKGSLDDMTDTKSMSPEQCCDNLRLWLAQPENKKWLLIIDNVDREPTEDGGFEVQDFFPPSSHGSILITTRVVQLSQLGKSIKVDRMSEGEAANLLDEHIGHVSEGQELSQVEPAGAKVALLRKLDGLPLAISQAGRFIYSMNLRPSTYLELYTSSKREAIDSLPDEICSAENLRNSIRTTWSISLNRLREKATADHGDSNDHFSAYRFLKLFTYFDPTDISYEILRRGLIGHNVPEWFRSTMTSRFRFLRIMEILLDLSLIDNNVAEGSYSIHHIVHDWLNSYVTMDTDNELLRLAVSAVAFSAPIVLNSAWRYEAQCAIIHAVHLYPRLLSSPGFDPMDYFIEYSRMDDETLALVSELRGGARGDGDANKCWRLMKFDLAFDGILQLLRAARRRREVVQILDIACDQMKTRQLTAADNQLDITSCSLILDYHCSLEDFHLKKNDMPAVTERLDSISQEFILQGSPSWGAKTWNIKSLILEGLGCKAEAIEAWYHVLESSHRDTECVLVHPTWMIFVNLRARIYATGQKKEVVRLHEKYKVEPWFILGS